MAVNIASMDVKSGADAEVARAIQQARLEFAFGSQPLALTVSILLAAMTVGVLMDFADASVLIGWLAVLTSVNLIRLYQQRQYSRDRLRENADLSLWEWRLFVGCLASGAIWGVSVFLFFPPQSDLQFFLAFVIAGVSAGAVSGLAVAPAAAYAFMIPCVLPLAIRLLAGGSAMHAVMGVMTLFYIMVLALIARRGHVQLTQMVTSRLEAKTSEVSRQISDERLRIATRAGEIGIWEWNLQSGALMWDARTCEIYGVDPAENRNTYEKWRQRVHLADIGRVESALNQAIATCGTFESEFRILRPQGEERTVRSAARVVQGEFGTVRRVTGINLDVTELKRLERMKSEFVSIVSHELRTPLTSIRGSLGLLRHNAAGELPEKAHEILQLAERNAERLGVLIDDLLDIERLETGKLAFNLKRQPLLPLLRQAVSANAHYATRHHVELRLLESDGMDNAIVSVDATRLIQVVTNLLSNAVKFSPAGAKVDVAMQLRDGRVRVNVSDRGPGIAPEFRSRIFTKFCQGDASDERRASGTGLGLAISKAIVEQMEGTIGFDTALGVGTTFFFELPLSDRRAPAH